MRKGRGREGREGGREGGEGREGGRREGSSISTKIKNFRLLLHKLRRNG